MKQIVCLKTNNKLNLLLILSNIRFVNLIK